VKKTIMIVAAAASLLAALLVFVCEDPKIFENPLDKNGSNYLYLDTTNEADKLKPSENGGVNLFDTTKGYRPCDMTNPTLNLRGDSPAIVWSNDTLKYNDWMNISKASGWLDSLITYTDGKGKGEKGNATPLSKPCLSDRTVKNYTDCVSENIGGGNNKMPAPGKYYIWYRVEKPECNKNTPYAERNRELEIKQYTPPDDGTPEIELLGYADADVKEGGPAYVDRGVVVTLNGVRDMNLLDSVVVKGVSPSGNNYRLKVDSPKPIAFSDVKLPDNPKAGDAYTVTYYANYKSKTSDKTTSAVKVRNVKVSADNTQKDAAVIVLNPYKYKLGNNVVDVMDTVLVDGGGAYVEKGVKEVYWLRDGTTKVPLDVNSVTRLPLPSFTGPSKTGKKVSYEINPGTGYDKGVAQRYVFVVDGHCESTSDRASKPAIEFVGSEALTIDAGRPWDYAASWKVNNKNLEEGAYTASDGIKYFIYFNGLDPNKPVTGTYKITYVGLGMCKEAPAAESERTITVR